MLANPESSCGGDRRSDHVYILEDRLKIALDQRTYLLSLTIVGIVITCREGVGTQHDPPLDLRAKFISTCAPEDIPYFGGRLARPVADAIITRQIGGGLCWSDQVINRQGVFSMGKTDLSDLGSQRF